MSFDLPPHLQTLNSIPTSSPPSGINHEQEEAFWGYMHTDDLFANFGFVPSPNELEKEDLATTTTQPTPAVAAAPAPTPISVGEERTQPQAQATLESFLAAFANEPNYLLSTPSGSGSGSGTISTRDILNNTSNVGTPRYEDEEDKPSGAKKLKSIGAGHVEIEEERNTEASARFRAKKKEREQAVEKRAKDLEAQVAKLAAEKASLENENRLLKAIVLNGTTGTGTGSTPGQGLLAGGGGGGQSQADALQNALAAFGKRKRE